MDHKITFFDDDLEDFDELMEMSQENSHPDTVPAVVLPPIVPAVFESPVTAVAAASPAALDAPLQLPKVQPELSTESKVDPASKVDTASKVDIASKVAPSNPSLSRCRACDGWHPLRFCEKFLQMSLEKRLRLVVMHGFCSRCLALSHQTSKCSSRGRCRRCQEDHHTLLHAGSTPPGKDKKSVVRSYPYSKPWSRPRQMSDSGPSEKTRISANSSFSSVSTLPLVGVTTLSPSLVVRLKSTSSSVSVRAVLDPCGRQSKICSSLVDGLQLPLTWLDGEPLCRLTVASAYDPEQCITLMARVCNLAHVFTPSEPVPAKLKEAYLGLPLADPTFYTVGRVALVFGPEVYAKIVTSRVQTAPGLPVAQYTIFGWVLTGICNN